MCSPSPSASSYSSTIPSDCPSSIPFETAHFLLQNLFLSSCCLIDSLNILFRNLRRSPFFTFEIIFHDFSLHRNFLHSISHEFTRQFDWFTQILFSKDVAGFDTISINILHYFLIRKNKILTSSLTIIFSKNSTQVKYVCFSYIRILFHESVW